MSDLEIQRENDIYKLIAGYIRINVNIWIPMDIVDVIHLFHGFYDISFETNIIPNDKYKLMELIYDHMNKYVTLNRIYSSQINGFSKNIFHELCDNKDGILILIKAENDYIFGGYTSKSIYVPKGSCKYIKDSKAFIFNLIPHNKVYPVIKDDSDRALYTQKLGIFTAFGKGRDLWIFYSKNGDKVRGYSKPQTYSFESPNDMIGDFSYSAVDIEAFQVLDQTQHLKE